MTGVSFIFICRGWILVANIPPTEESFLETVTDAVLAMTPMGPVAVLVFFVPLWGPQVALLGLTNTRNRVSPTAGATYTLMDAMVLTAMFAMATSLTTLIRDELDITFFYIALGCTNTLAALMWLKCNKFMTANQITSVWKRVVVQLFVYPSAIIAIGYLAMATLMLLSGLLETAENRDQRYTIYMSALGIIMAIAIAWISLVRFVFASVIGPDR